MSAMCIKFTKYRSIVLIYKDLGTLRPKKINDGFPLTGPKFKGSVGRDSYNWLMGLNKK